MKALKHKFPICITALIAVLFGFAIAFACQNLTNITANAAQNLTITVKDTATTYGRGLPSFTVEYNGFLSVQDEEYLLNNIKFETNCGPKPAVGVYTVTPYGLNMPNYNITYNSGTLTVEKRELFVTANNIYLTYGQKIPEFTVYYSGFVYDDDPSVLDGQLEFDCPAQEIPMPKDYYIVISGLSSPNYRIRHEFGTLYVDKLTQTQTIAQLYVTNRSADEIQLNFIEGAEYSADNGKTWQDSAIFKGLTPNTIYSFVARYKETDIYHAGTASQPVTASTTKSEQSTTLIIILAIIGTFATAGIISATIYIAKTKSQKK